MIVQRLFNVILTDYLSNIITVYIGFIEETNFM